MRPVLAVPPQPGPAASSEPGRFPENCASRRYDGDTLLIYGLVERKKLRQVWFDPSPIRRVAAILYAASGSSIVSGRCTPSVALTTLFTIECMSMTISSAVL